jgi:hypothetical protein
LSIEFIPLFLIQRGAVGGLSVKIAARVAPLGTRAGRATP